MSGVFGGTIEVFHYLNADRAIAPKEPSGAWHAFLIL